MTRIPYVCGECGASEVKLWRRYQTFLNHQSLLCAAHTAADQHADVAAIDSEGRYLDPQVGFRVDSVGWMVPAVPTDDGETFWGYTSIPQVGVDWWRGLPLDKR